MTFKDYWKRKKKIQDKNKKIKYSIKLEKVKNKYNKKPFETSKFLAIYLFAFFNIITIYTMVMMWVYADTSNLGVLITSLIAPVITYGIYCTKAYMAKKEEEMLKFDKMKYGDKLQKYDEWLSANGFNLDENICDITEESTEEIVEDVVETDMNDEDSCK